MNKTVTATVPEQKHSERGGRNAAGGGTGQETRHFPLCTAGGAGPAVGVPPATGPPGRRQHLLLSDWWALSTRGPL